MKERPILFKAEMVNAILSGNKTQTRRIAKDLVDRTPYDICPHGDEKEICAWCEMGVKETSPYGKVGDQLWVRETHAVCDEGISYAADGKLNFLRYRPSIHMFRRYSRIQLEITGIRVERLNDISTEEIKAEGVVQRFPNVNDKFTPDILKGQFMDLWQSINGDGSWNENPWVWVVEFKQI